MKMRIYHRNEEVAATIYMPEKSIIIYELIEEMITDFLEKVPLHLMGLIKFDYNGNKSKC